MGVQTFPGSVTFSGLDNLTSVIAIPSCSDDSDCPSQTSCLSSGTCGDFVPTPIDDLIRVISDPNFLPTLKDGTKYLKAISIFRNRLESKGTTLFRMLKLLVRGILRDTDQKDFLLESSDIALAAKRIDSNQDVQFSFGSSGSKVFVPLQALQFQRAVAVFSSFQFNPLLSPSAQVLANVTSLEFLDDQFGRIDIRNSPKEINISIPFDGDSKDLACIYWSETESKWSTDGCKPIINVGSIDCLCNHLTNFSLGKPNVQPAATVAQPTNYTPIIIGVVVGGVVLLGIIAIIIFVVISKRNSRKKSRRHAEEYSVELKMEDKADINSSEIKVENKLGSGANSAVYLASYGLSQVAVKIPLRGNKLSKEISIIKSLKHPNVVQYLGSYISEEKEICMVMEYMESGTLLDLVRNQNPSQFVLLSLISDVSAGMRYLDECNVIHSDLSSRNVLLKPFESGFVAKIGDFGMATRRKESSHPETSNLPVRWTAPEVLKDPTKISNKSDVWMFGVVLYEMFEKGIVPYGDLSNEQVSKLVISSGNGLKSSEWPQKIESLALSCLSSDPSKRPSFEEIVKITSNLVQKNERGKSVMIEADIYAGGLQSSSAV
eukprot:TRINITY_DN6326_c0_g1_i1.p1 TRINITY_DN6326_c0_g1~~TRINITY_DN6326_c0_g1_i1.p1  ORF type:complete len:604 (-),score=173.73 TRINITY_DN6326_c0_g1_i1:13-1824(-)